VVFTFKTQDFNTSFTTCFPIISITIVLNIFYFFTAISNSPENSRNFHTLSEWIARSNTCSRVRAQTQRFDEPKPKSLWWDDFLMKHPRPRKWPSLLSILNLAANNIRSADRGTREFARIASLRWVDTYKTYVQVYANVRFTRTHFWAYSKIFSPLHRTRVPATIVSLERWSSRVQRR